VPKSDGLRLTPVPRYRRCCRSTSGVNMRISPSHRKRPVALLVLGFVVLATAASGCSSSTSSPASNAVSGSDASVHANAIPSFYRPPQPLTEAPAGTLIRSQRVNGVPGIPAGATVWRILFHSTTIYGADLAESGYVVAPGGPAPGSGFPVIAWAHGTTGFAAPCAPSLFTASGGGTGPYLIPGLDRYLRAGFVVAAADYQGQGVADGVHPYLLGASEGRAVLDATRAARQLAGVRTENTVIIYGHSQGGHAALFAGEMAPGYAPDLHVVGVVAAAPATGLSSLISIIGNPAGRRFLSFSVPAAYSWTQTYSDLPSTDVFTSAGERFASSEVTRGCLDAFARAVASHHVTPGGTFTSSAETNPAVVAHAQANDPGSVRTPVPMLVLQGTADGTVPPPLTDSFVTAKACPIGDSVEYLHVKGATHATVVFISVPTILKWMEGRLAGGQEPSTCGQPGDASTLTH
jgi:alpha-beta hydrolase superfamily lysophospholipase